MKVYVVYSGAKVVLNANNRWSSMTFELPLTFMDHELHSEDEHKTIFKHNNVKYHVDHSDVRVFR